MRIGLDLSIVSVNQAGSGIYARRLADALKMIDGMNEFYFFSVGQQRDMSSRKTIRTRLDTLYRDLEWMHFQLPLKAHRAKVELLHLPAGIIPLQSPCPVVLTIHDTALFQMPDYFPSWQRYYFRALGPRSAHKANRILTISENSKRDIVAQFGVSPDKVVVTYLAAAPEFKPLSADEVALVKQRYGLERFILTVGTLEPRKNLVRLLEAFARLKNNGDSHQLIHAGPLGWLNDDVKLAVMRLDLQNSVRFLGRVPLVDLVRLYNAADLFVYPSLYEGFGLPVLEAMSCGCPTVTSNVSSLPEVAGEAALLVDPYNIDELVGVIDRVLCDQTMSDKLRKSGLQRSQCFSWQRCALETLQVYQEAIRD